MNNKKLMAIISVVLVLGLSVFAVADTSTSLKLGDTNGDGVITAADALEVLQYSVGKIDSFSAETSTDIGGQMPPIPGTTDYIQHAESSITDFLTWIKSEEALIEDNGRMAPGIKEILGADVIIPSTVYDEYVQRASYNGDETDNGFEVLIFRFTNWINGKGQISYRIEEKISASNISTYDYYDEILEYDVPVYDLPGYEDYYSVYFKKTVEFNGMTQDCVVCEVSNSTGVVTCRVMFVYNGYPITLLVQHSGNYDALVDFFAEFTFTTLS